MRKEDAESDRDETSEAKISNTKVLFLNSTSHSHSSRFVCFDYSWPLTSIFLLDLVASCTCDQWCAAESVSLTGYSVVTTAPAKMINYIYKKKP